MFLHLIDQPHITTFSTTRQETLTQALETCHLTNFPLVQMEQVHGAKCAIITEPISQTVADVDAILTTLPNLTLCVRTADCLPILLSYPSGLIGVIHAGRAGTQQKITQQTLTKINTEFNITDNLHLWFGPRICQKCYQIDRDANTYFDLINQNLEQINTVFAPEKYSLTISENCTVHENNTFFSYRHEKTADRQFSGICRTGE